MEEKKTAAKPITEGKSLPNVLTTSNSKRNLYVILGIVGIVLLSVGGYVYYLLSLQGAKPPMVAKEVQPPTPTPASPSATFVFYDDLSGEEKFSVAYNFSDRILNAGFAYSPFYSIQVARADATRKIADISFLRLGDTAATVRITPYTGSKKTFTEEKNTQCRKEIATKNRVLFACSDGEGMSYVVYLLGANSLEMHVNSTDPKAHASLIRSIISSATNHL